MGTLVLTGATSGSTTIQPTDAVTVTLTTPSTSGTLATTSGSIATATNIAGGSAGVVPYQTGSGATAFTSVGTSGQVLTSNGSSAPTWTSVTTSPAGSTGAIQVNSSGSFGVAGNINGSTTVGFKNRIINGSFNVDQRNAGASFTAVDNAYGLDRWRTFLGAASKFTVQQQTSVVPSNTTYAAKITSTSSYTVGSTEAFCINQPIEGFNIADLGWGTATAKTVTLSFQVYSSLTGTFSGSIFNNAWDRSYCFTYSVASANTWTSISITISGDTTGTWLTNNSGGLVLNFSLGCGSTFNGTANAWNAGRYASTSGSVSVVGTNGATWYVTNVQLELGSQATSFDFRDYGKELILCQRYFCSSFADGVAPANTSVGIGTMGYYTGMVIVGGADIRTASMPFPVSMRTTPTITFYKTLNSGTNGLWAYFNGGGWVTAGSTVSDNINNKGFNADMGIGGGSTGQAFMCSGMWSATAEL